jgi:hypothetical protein
VDGANTVLEVHIPITFFVQKESYKTEIYLADLPWEFNAGFVEPWKSLAGFRVVTRIPAISGSSTNSGGVEAVAS